MSKIEELAIEVSIAEHDVSLCDKQKRDAEDRLSSAKARLAGAVDAEIARRRERALEQ